MFIFVQSESICINRMMDQSGCRVGVDGRRKHLQFFLRFFIWETVADAAAELRYEGTRGTAVQYSTVQYCKAGTNESSSEIKKGSFWNHLMVMGSDHR